MKLEKKFGQSPVFVASARMENGGMARNASPACLLKEAIQVISCGYEDKTEWGKEVSSLFQTFLVFVQSILILMMTLVKKISDWVDLWFCYRRYSYWF